MHENAQHSRDRYGRTCEGILLIFGKNAHWNDEGHYVKKGVLFEMSARREEHVMWKSFGDEREMFSFVAASPMDRAYFCNGTGGHQGAIERPGYTEAVTVVALFARTSITEDFGRTSRKIERKEESPRTCAGVFYVIMRLAMSERMK